MEQYNEPIVYYKLKKRAWIFLKGTTVHQRVEHCYVNTTQRRKTIEKKTDFKQNAFASPVNHAAVSKYR